MSRVLLLFLISILVSCNGDGSNQNASIIASLLIEDKFGQETDQFVVGDDVVITVKVQNQASIPRTIEFTAPLISVGIFSEDGNELIYDPDFGISAPQVIQETIINPMGTIYRIVTWKGVDNSGSQVSPARYQVRAHISGFENDGDVIQSPEAAFISLH